MDIDANTRFIVVPTQNVALGMYVAHLDRPWLDTPFLFQGFEVTEKWEILELEKYCEYVYIDPGRSMITLSGVPRYEVPSTIVRKLSAADIEQVKAKNGASLATTPEAIESRRCELYRSMSEEPQEVYKDKHSQKREAASAIKAYDYAREKTGRLLKAIDGGKPVEAKHCRGVVKYIAESVIRNADALAWLVYLRKGENLEFDRQISSAIWCAIFARYLGFPPKALLDIASGGLLMDIGISRMSRNLKERTGEFAVREKLAMRAHVSTGLEILRRIQGITPRVARMMAQHHERSNGGGYPDGLTESAISVWGRYGGLIDCYDAMISENLYSSAMSSYDAVRELNSLTGIHFPSILVEQFVLAMGMFPSGSIVELNTGEVGIVIKQHAVRKLRPTILLVLDANKTEKRRTSTIDLSSFASGEKERNPRWIVDGHPPGAFGVDPKAHFI